jgi:hypothetical protein
MLSYLQVKVYVFAKLFSIKIKYPQWYTITRDPLLLLLGGALAVARQSRSKPRVRFLAYARNRLRNPRRIEWISRYLKI